jgi:aryl-phospho-beta-D-glucosidase BglC (GH1 family)
MNRILVLCSVLIVLVFAGGQPGWTVQGERLWWERGADKWYYKDDWKGMALSGGRSYRKVIELPTRASSGWIVTWEDRFYRLTVNGTLVEEDHTSGIIEDHDLTRFIRGSDRVEILIEADGRVVAEGEVVAEDGQRFSFATGGDWEIPGSTRKPATRLMVAEPSSGAFHRSHNGLLMTYNDEEKGKTLIAKGFARIQKLNEQGLFLLRRFCPSEEILDLSDNTLRLQAERTIQPLIAPARKILEGQAVPAQEAGKFQDAIAAAHEAGRMLASAEAMLESALQIYKTERDVLHLENCLEIMSSEKVSLPDYSNAMLELKRMLSGARRDHELQDWANVLKTTGRAKDEISRFEQELSGLWGFPIGELDEFPEDRFGWLNARELMGHDPAWWEFNISPDSIACLDLSGLWEFRIDPNNEGEKNGWHSGKEIEKGPWRCIYAPRAWEWQGVQEFNENSPTDCPYRLGDRRTGDKPYNGFAWYRKRVFVPADWAGQPVILRIGEVKNWVRIFVNGEKALNEGTANPAGRGEYPIPEAMLRFGEENLIAIQVYNHDNLGGITSGPLYLALKGQVPEIAETPGPLRYVDEIRWPNTGKDGRCILLASALSPGVVFSTNEPTLWLWGWKMKGYSNPAGLCVMAKGKQRLFQTEEGHPVAFEGEELTENWVLLESGNENTRSVLLVLEKRPVRVAWEKNALGQWGIRLDFGDSVGRAIIVCFPGGQKLSDEDCRFWSRALLAYPISVSELCKPNREQLVGDFWLKYDYLVTRDFCETDPLYVSPLPMLFSYGMKHGYPGLQPEGIRQTNYFFEYAAYHVAEQPVLRFRAPLVDRSKVLKGIGELFGKMSSSSNTRCGITEDQMFRDMGEWGFDHCRYAFAFHADWDIPLCRWMGGPLLDNERAWQRLDELVKKCNNNGMMMMLTWFFNEDSPQRDADNRVRNSSAYWRKRPETRENAYELWRRIAERYKDLPAEAISYDFFNEPAYMEPDDWNRIIKELTEIVRSVDKKHMIVVEGGDGWAQPFWCRWMEPTGDPNTMYSFHHYGKHWGYGYDEYYPSYRRTYEESQVDPWLQAILFGIRHRVPIHCGEFGVSQISPDEDYAMWLNDYLALFERFGIGWNWWNYSGSDIYRTGLVCGKKLSPNVAILTKWVAKGPSKKPLQRSP